MQFHSLKRTHKNRKTVSVGRGGRRGKTAGRGTKGQNARAGRKKRPELRDLVKKIPKLRGYRFTSIQTKPFSLALRTVERHFKAGETVNFETLVDKGLVTNTRALRSGVKIVGNALKVKVAVVGCLVSKGAKIAIEAAGGSVA